VIGQVLPEKSALVGVALNVLRLCLVDERIDDQVAAAGAAGMVQWQTSDIVGIMSIAHQLVAIEGERVGARSDEAANDEVGAGGRRGGIVQRLAAVGISSTHLAF